VTVVLCVRILAFNLKVTTVQELPYQDALCARVYTHTSKYNIVSARTPKHNVHTRRNLSTHIRSASRDSPRNVTLDLLISSAFCKGPGPTQAKSAPANNCFFQGSLEPLSPPNVRTPRL